MDDIAYLLLGIALLCLWIVIAQGRPDLRRRLISASAFGAVAGPLAELWYLHDYWSPPATFHVGIFAPEDVLFGFAITGVAAVIVQWWTGKHSMKVSEGHPRIFMAMLPLSTAFLIFFANVLGWQSILVSAVMFLLGAAIMLNFRHDLLRLSLESGIATMLVIIPIYVIVFGVLAPGYWDRYWLWAGTPWGWMVLPGVPWTEVFWYFCWGTLAGITGHFIRGTSPRQS